MMVVDESYKKKRKKKYVTQRGTQKPEPNFEKRVGNKKLGKRKKK